MHPTQKHSSLLRTATGLAVLAVCAACSRETPPPTAADADAAVQAGQPLETREPNSPDFKPAFDGQTRVGGVSSDIALDVSEVAKGIASGWAFEFLPDQRILVTERQGNLRIVGEDGQLSEPLRGLPEVWFKGQGGLLDVALDPQFATNRTIYWTYA